MFHHPWFLVLLITVPPVIWFTTRASSVLTYSSIGLFVQTPRSWRQRLSLMPAVLLAAAMTCLILGLARPRTPTRGRNPIGHPSVAGSCTSASDWVC